MKVSGLISMKTINYKNINWVYRHGALIPYVSPHRTVLLSKEEEKEFLQKSKAYFIRYNCDFDTEESEFWYIIKDNIEGLEELSSNTRSKIRRGWQRFYTQKISKEYMLNYGFNVYNEALKRYNTFESNMKADEFKQYIDEIDESSYDFWGVFEKETKELVAYSQNFIDDKACFYEEIFSTPSSLKKYSNYVLFYDMNKYYLDDLGFRYVHDGSRNVSHETNIHKFLEEKFKFRRAYATMKIAYRSDIAIIVSLLYPIRSFLGKIRLPLFEKVSVLLKHEEIRRSFVQR